ncbi:MAG: magnesium transporter [Porticoccaceae bacterium]|nr:magnesium transporter [Porticoccaceae bacterium]
MDNTEASEAADTILTRRFLLDFPRDAARQIEHTPLEAVARALVDQPLYALLPVWPHLVPQVARDLLVSLPTEKGCQLLAELQPQQAVRLLGQLDDEERAAFLEKLDGAIAREIKRLMTYPENSAGRLMDTQILLLHGDNTAGEALDTLRTTRMKTARSLFLSDSEGRLAGKVLLQDIATSAPETPLDHLVQPVTAAVNSTAPREEISDLFEQHRLFDLPVLDVDGRVLGIINHANLVQVSQEDISSDVLAMVGASREERALSKPLFAVQKRMPWLQINLLTAFLAASVVGLFEDTIARFTALAVLLPVVAGQSGNAGAQALAVTMRGLALREISIRHWLRVMFKEIRVGLINGLCIAATCGVGVYLWSQSIGLVLVICSAMVLAMVIAGFAGAVVPIALVRLGQDPAQSSSIILTTVTDIAGFFAFLGIATALAGML